MWPFSRKPNIVDLLDREDVNGLVQALRHSDPAVRRDAVVALGHLKDMRASDALIRTLRDQSPEVRHHAIAALKSIEDDCDLAPVLGYLREGSRDFDAGSVRARRATRTRPPNEIVSRVLAAFCTDPHRGIREAAAFALGVIGDHATVDAVLPLLRDPDVAMRATAVLALGAIGNPTAAGAVVQALSDGDPHVKYLALLAITLLGGPESVQTFARLLDDPDADVRLRAILAVQDLPECDRTAVTIVEALRRKVSDPVALIRRAAAFRLGVLRDAGSVAGLLAALGDADAEVRAGVAVALGFLRDSRAIQPLQALSVNDPAPTVRQKADEAVRMICA